jgi:hypothetical protein
MFAYTDPAGRNFLSNSTVEAEFQQQLAAQYETSARTINSAFTWFEAFSHLSGGQAATVRAVEWTAFPLTAATTDANIDNKRFAHQDEYVEWRIEKKSGRLAKVTFTTEFREYFEAYAAMGFDAIKAAIVDVIPAADPTEAELFGLGVNSTAQLPIARGQSFIANLTNNPWNNGKKGIVCLTQQFNTLGALFLLLTQCGVKSAGAPENTCDLVGGACGPGRSSDPTICAVSQKAVRSQLGYTLRDPAGIRISKLEGVWKLDGKAIDINDTTTSSAIWQVSRNGRRGVLTIPPKLTLDDKPVVSGAQVSRRLHVAADLLVAPDSSLPDWARISAESGSRGPG